MKPAINGGLMCSIIPKGVLLYRHLSKDEPNTDNRKSLIKG